MRLTLIMTSFLLLAGCATQIDTGYIAQMNGYVGGSEKVLIAAMGPPDRTYKLHGGEKIVTYEQVRDSYIDGSGLGLCMGGFDPRFGYSACHGNEPRRIISQFCDVSFNIIRGKVTNWSQKGNACPRVQ